MIAELVGAPTARPWPASVVLDGEYGIAGVALTVPVTLGHSGVERILEWELTDDQAAGLHAGAEVVHASLAAVDLA
jgi:L-lactate dehydrogenase